MSSTETISQIFGNSTSVPGSLVVEKMITLGIAICPEFAEPIIKNWIDEGLLIQNEKNLEIAPQGPSKDEIKQKWFAMRQYEKTHPNPVHLKVQAESFKKWCNWGYTIFDKDLRKECEKLGYISPSSQERGQFQKLLQS